jgi:uncharacterized membrane protein
MMMGGGMMAGSLERNARGRRSEFRRGSEEFFARNIEEIARLERRDRITMGASDHVASHMTAFTGSMQFVALHALLLAGWILAAALWGIDPYPFEFLGFVLGVEAIVLSAFVLMSQNRQALQADRRAKVDLEISMIAEQEVTKVMDMLVEIHDALGIEHEDDDELHQMRQPMHAETIADAVDEAEGRVNPDAAEGPDSAVDTEA